LVSLHASHQYAWPHLLALYRLRARIAASRFPRNQILNSEIMLLIEAVARDGENTLLRCAALQIARSQLVLGRPLDALSRLEALLIEGY